MEKKHINDLAESIIPDRYKTIKGITPSTTYDLLYHCCFCRNVNNDKLDSLYLDKGFNVLLFKCTDIEMIYLQKKYEISSGVCNTCKDKYTL